MTKLFFIFFVFGLLLFSLAGNTFADVTCQPVYGGGQTCVTTGNILVNKTVQNPATGQFVDNLGINDPKFSPGQTITFNIALTNTGSSTILQTSVKDTLPPTVIFISGPGNFDQNSKTLTFIVDNLTANETRNFTLQGRIVDANQLQQDITCDPDKTTNIIIATTNTGQTSTDFTKFCTQKGATTKGGLPVFPPSNVTTTPSTGPELIPLIGLLPAGIGGWFLRKKSGGKK